MNADRTIVLLPVGRYMDGPEKGRTFPARADSPRYIKTHYPSAPDRFSRLTYELKWWQYPGGRREARYYLTDESADDYRICPDCYRS